jgi:hypothetical protein
MRYPLGKLPARPGAVELRLMDFFDMTKLPTIPQTFGHERLVSTWQMLGNDQFGDCVWAGAAHETMMWNASAARIVTFTDTSVLSDYSALTGFNPADPSTDQGTDMAKAAAYRRKTGVLDAAGRRHPVAAYLALKPGSLKELYAAAYLFGAVGVGLQFPGTAMDQFNAGQPWRVVPGANIEGGHYVPVVARRGGLIDVVTWGRIQPMTEAFFEEYCDEALVYLSEEYLTGGKSPEGFNDAQLRAELTRVTAA